MRPLLVTTALLIAGFLAGCGDGFTIIEPPIRRPVPIYPKLVSPYLVMEALRIAYMFRDTTELKLIYDDNYQGTSADQNVPGTPFTFSKFDENQHLSKLAHRQDIAVSILTDSHMTRTADASDPPGWALIQNPIASLSVTDSGFTYNVDIAHEVMDFHFIPQLDSTAVTDTTWKIVRWIEVRAVVP